MRADASATLALVSVGWEGGGGGAYHPAPGSGRKCTLLLSAGVQPGAFLNPGAGSGPTWTQK